jgi:hypothetical protein
VSTRPGPDPVFIVGLYKNGTSWLLSALAAHPEFAALRELDVLRSVAGRDGRVLLPAHERLANVFGKSAFCGLKAEQLAQASRDGLYERPAHEVVAALQSMLRAEGSKAQLGADGRPLVFLNFETPLLERAFEAVRDAVTSKAAIDGFLTALGPGYPVGRRLVLKGADQILCLDALCEYYPGAFRIAIVRDGRDAAVSAFHYRRVMRAQRMAWHHDHLSFIKPFALAREAAIGGVTALRSLVGYGPDWRLGRSMSVWADRVRRVLAAAEQGQLMVIRYEDLLADFEVEFGKLLARLGVDHSRATLAAVAKASSFETMSGRPRGVSGESVVRKGVAGEWREELTARDRALAWRVAGTELTAMGYAQDGELQGFQAPGG